MTASSIKHDFVIHNEDAREPIYLEPRSGVHRNTLIWLHGFAQNGESQLKYFDENQHPVIDEFTKVVLLTAPKIDCLYKGRQKPRNSWVSSLNPAETYGYTVEYVNNYIEEEVKFFQDDYSKILIGGFSQGGVMSAALALGNTDFRLGGAIVCSAFYHSNCPVLRNDIPVVIYHAEDDEVVPAFEACKTYRDFLVKNKVPFEFISVEMAGHEISFGGRDLINQWYREVTTTGSSTGYKVAKL